MHRLIRTTGIILKKNNYQEADRLLTVLTPDHGVIRCMAKGARLFLSPLSGKTELLTEIAFAAYRGKTFHHLRDTVSLTPPPWPEKQMDEMNHLFAMAAITARLLPEADAAPRVYTLLKDALDLFRRARRPETVLFAYLVRLLAELGYLSTERWNGRLRGALVFLKESHPETLMHETLPPALAEEVGRELKTLLSETGVEHPLL